MWKDILIVGTAVAGLSLGAMRILGSRGFCGTPNMPYAFVALLGLALIALGLVVGAAQWAWRRTRSRKE